MTSIANRLRYSIDESSAAHVAQHLFKCADSFVPPLSVDIVEYAKKIRKHASTLEAWVDEELAGLVAVYTNTPPTAFITNVSVVRIYSGQGINDYSSQTTGQCSTAIVAYKFAHENESISTRE